MRMRRPQDPREQFRDRCFPACDDDIWQDWVDSSRRNYRSLADLIADRTIRDGFKARALVVLLAPDEARLPVYWRREPGSFRSMLEVGMVSLSSLSPALQDLARELIVHACQILESSLPGAYRERARASCIRYIIDLLGVSSASQGEQLWRYFDINDPAPYYTMEDCSGYEPWRALMCHPQISMHWKRLADQRLRNVIDEELTGRSQPRTEWERALTCYIRHLNFALFGVSETSKFPYDVDLLSDQLRYVLTLDREAVGSGLVEPHNLATVMHLLSSRQHRLVARQVTYFVVNDSRPRYEVQSARDLVAARLMLDTLGLRDGELKGRLEELIRRGEAVVAARRTEHQATSSRRRELRGRMRRPE